MIKPTGLDMRRVLGYLIFYMTVTHILKNLGFNLVEQIIIPIAFTISNSLLKD